MLRRDHAGEGAQHSTASPLKRELRPSPPTPTRPKAQENDLPLLSPIIRTPSERTIARIRTDYPGWDVYALQAEFDDWIAQNAERKPQDYEAAFYGFVRRHHENNRHQLAT